MTPSPYDEYSYAFIFLMMRKVLYGVNLYLLLVSFFLFIYLDMSFTGSTNYWLLRLSCLTVLSGSQETKLTPLEHVTSLDTKRWGFGKQVLHTISNQILVYKQIGILLILQWDRYIWGAANSDGSSEATSWAARGTATDEHICILLALFVFGCKSLKVANSWKKWVVLTVVSGSKKDATSDRRTGKGPAHDVWKAKYGFLQTGTRRQSKWENAWKLFRGGRFSPTKASEKQWMKGEVSRDDISIKVKTVCWWRSRVWLIRVGAFCLLSS